MRNLLENTPREFSKVWDTSIEPRGEERGQEAKASEWPH